MRRSVVLVTVALCGCGCEITTPKVARIPWRQAEYDALAKTGTGILRGQAFLKTRGGDVKTAAGNPVSLDPVTSSSRQWYEVVILQNKELEPADDATKAHILEYKRLTTADADGRFEFKNVPPGDYFLSTQVIWEAPTGYQGSLVKQGGPIVKQITVNDGEEQQVILTR